MLSMSRANRPLAILGWAGWFAAVVLAQSPFVPQGVEYPVTGGLVGDQTHPQVSLSSSGGYAVWADNAVDGKGLGIAAVELNGYSSPISSRMIRVNQDAAGDQEHPVAQVLAGGGAMFVWQGGAPGAQDIWARVLSSSSTFSTGDVRVNTATGNQHADPAIARLADGNLALAWSSYGQDGSMQGVYVQRLSPAAAKLGPETQVNQFAAYNQRTPAIAAQGNGGYVVVWVSEQQRGLNTVDLYARRFDSAGAPAGNEFLINATTNVCANPSVCGLPSGGFMVVWSQLILSQFTNGWDVVGAAFDSAGRRIGSEQTVNGYIPDNQYVPKLACLGNQLLAVWTSDRQDGSREGIYGRFLASDATPLGDEFQVHTTMTSRQVHPALASDGSKRFLALWSSYVGGEASFEILGQRFAADTTLAQPSPPVVLPLDWGSLLVSWPPLAGYTNFLAYLLYQDGNSIPTVLTNNYQVVRYLFPQSTHTFQLAYQLVGPQLSPVSLPGSGTTWGWDYTGVAGLPDGLPDDWQVKHWGDDPALWPTKGADSDGDGATNWEEFLAGTDPKDRYSVLRITVGPTTGGVLVAWNAVPASIYQLQSSHDLKNWANTGAPQFAASITAQAVLPASGSPTYYRVIRVR
jgi:hypothetical protein